MKNYRIELKDYVTEATAKLLREAGYPQNTAGIAVQKIDNSPDSELDIRDQYTQPSLWDAMKWLREEKQVFIRINKCTATESVNVGVWKARSISNYTATLCALSFEKWLTRCDTYEQACDAGIAAVCKWLIAHATNDGSRTE